MQTAAAALIAFHTLSFYDVKFLLFAVSVMRYVATCESQNVTTFAFYID